MLIYKLYIYLLCISLIGIADAFQQIPGQTESSEDSIEEFLTEDPEKTEIASQNKISELENQIEQLKQQISLQSESSDVKNDSQPTSVAKNKDPAEEVVKTETDDKSELQPTSVIETQDSLEKAESDVQNNSQLASIVEAQEQLKKDLQAEIEKLKKQMGNQNAEKSDSKEKQPEQNSKEPKVYDENFDMIKEPVEKLKEIIAEYKEKATEPQINNTQPFELTKCVVMTLPAELFKDSSIIEESIETLSDIIVLFEKIAATSQIATDLLNSVYYLVSKNGITDKVMQLQHNKAMSKEQAQQILEETWGHISNFSKSNTANSLISATLKSAEAVQIPSSFLFSAFKCSFNAIKQYIPQQKNTCQEFSRKGKTLSSNLTNLTVFIKSIKDSNETPNVLKSSLENNEKCLQSVSNIIQKLIRSIENALKENELYLSRCEPILKTLTSLKKSDKILDYIEN